MLDYFPFFSLDNNEFFAILHDSQPHSNLNVNSLLDKFAELSNNDFYNNLKN